MGWAGPGAVAEEEQLSAEEARHVIRRSLAMLGAHRRKAFGALAVVLVYTGTNVLGPVVIRFGIDNGIKVVGGDTAMLNLAVGMFVLIAVTQFVSHRVQLVKVAEVGQLFLRDMRIRVFRHIQSLSMSFFDREKTGVLVARMTSDVESIQQLVEMGLLQFVANGLLLVFSAAMLVALSWKLALVCLLVLPGVIAASIKFQRDSNRAYLQVREEIGETLSTMQEGIAGVRIIQAFTREGAEIGRFSRRNRTLYDAHMDSVKVSAWYLPVIEFSGIGTQALVIGVGGWLAIQGEVTIGTIAAFVLLLSNLFEPVQQLSQLFNQLQQSGAALQKLFGLLDTRTELPERQGAVDLPREGDIEVRDVSFRYTDDQPMVLQDVDLTLRAGERLALVGPTGAGKSTLAKLMARLYDPTEGSITFGGVDLRDATLGSLRRRIVVVPQEGFLFNGSIRENIRIARADATDEEVEDALRAVNAYERFATLPDGIDTQVNARGSRLSGGEKQLVSLARVALVDPAVLVLDEATSSLDPGTEVLVERAMDRLMEGRGVIVIAHRLSTAERCDRVGVVDGGHLIELGTHEELLARDGRYTQLFNSWLGNIGAGPDGAAAPAEAHDRAETAEEAPVSGGD